MNKEKSGSQACLSSAGSCGMASATCFVFAAANYTVKKPFWGDMAVGLGVFILAISAVFLGLAFLLFLDERKWGSDE